MSAAEAEFTTRLHCLSRAWLPKLLECPIGRRLLVIAPHPDDEVIGPGGLLLRHKGQSEILLIAVFNGEAGGRLESGPWRDDPAYKAKLAAERRNEFEESAHRLGAEIVGYMSLPDGAVLPSIENAKRLRDLVNVARPDVVLMPWLLDRHRDHRVVNVLYAWGCSDVEATVLGFEVWDLIHGNAMLDISDCLEQKLELMRVYRTQLATVDYVPMFEALARVRAFTHGVRSDRSGAAEVFLALPGREYCELVQSMYGAPGNLGGNAGIIF